MKRTQTATHWGVNLIEQVDPDVAQLIQREDQRQMETIALIPSENYIFPAAAEALSSSLTNKYSEGYPHVWKDGQRVEQNGRYYQGQENINALEKLAIERTLQLFTPDPEQYHANVQPLSGAPANLAVISAFLKPGDTLLGLSLDDGGHLTHGHKVNITGQYFQAVQYKLNQDQELDYEQVERLAREHKPRLMFCGATAYPLTIDFARLGSIAKEHGAILVADIAHISGFCVTGEHPHPFPHADIVTTTTHKLLRGPRGGLIIAKKQYGRAIDRALFPGFQGGPHMNTIAGIAIMLKEVMTEDYKRYARQVKLNAAVLCEALQQGGFNIIGGRTDNHLILMDVVHCQEDVRSVNGARFAEKLEQAGIVANKNTVPGDEKPWLPSGIRLGTPAVTALGMKEQDMLQIAAWIIEAAKCSAEDPRLAVMREEVKRFMQRFAE